MVSAFGRLHEGEADVRLRGNNLPIDIALVMADIDALDWIVAERGIVEAKHPEIVCEICSECDRQNCSRSDHRSGKSPHPFLPIFNSFSIGYARFVPRKWRTNLTGAPTGFKDVGCCNRFIGWMDPVAAGSLFAPLTGSANRAIKPAMKTVICIICRKIIR